MSIASHPTIESTKSSTAAAEKPALRLRMLPSSLRSEALYLWRKLENELSNRRLACSSIWTQTWLDHFGELIPHQFVVATRDTQTCGIALLTQGVQQAAGPFGLQTWHVGTAGEPEQDSIFVEYNEVLATDDDRDAFLVALGQWFQDNTACDEFRLDGFEVNSLQAVLERNPLACVQRSPSHYFNLVEPRQLNVDPITRLGTHTRYNIRKNIRLLGEVTATWAETAEVAESLFHPMVKFHQAHWQSLGYPGVYASKRFHDFHLDLIHRAVPLGLMTIFGLSSGGKLVACSQVIVDSNRALLYQCGRTEATRRSSVGLALDYLCICECLRRGYDAVDFLAGDTEHKRRLSTHHAELAWVVWRRPNLKNSAIDAMRRIKQVASTIRSLRFGIAESASTEIPTESSENRQAD
jgi:hypothetical protein